MATSKTAPVSETQLSLIAKDACETTFSTTTTYQHSQTESWNGSIINKILSSLISSASTTTSASEPTPSQKPQYKYAVTSTIIQHLTDMAPTTTSASTSTQTDTQQTATSPTANGSGAAVTKESEPEKGRRGMHSATGAYWNEETDGMWNYKWEGGEGKGMDVVISVIWVAVG